MTGLADRFLIAKRWLTSFLKAEWRPEDYPTGVRKQVGVPRDATWSAQVLNWPGPVGLGATPDEARAALEANLLAIAENRRGAGKAMPRPGTGLPIEFAATEVVTADPILLDEFIAKALGFGPDDPVFISDESTISDFGDDERVAEIRNNIREHFQVLLDEPEPVRIADVLGKIRDRREA